MVTKWVTNKQTNKQTCSRDLPENLIVTHLVMKFPDFYGTQRFLTKLRAHQ